MQNTEQLPPDAPAGAARLSRRALLETAAAAGVALGLAALSVPVLVQAQAGGAGAAGTGLAAADFHRLSQFLTGGEPLDATLAARYQAVLLKRDPAFDAAAQDLLRLVDSSQATHVDALLAQPALADGPLRGTLQRIVSAWYLGIVGDDQGTELVAYANALMYRPTRGILDIPSYGSGPDTWGHKPVAPQAQSKP